MDLVVLSSEERVFAEINHNLIYDFLHKRGKDIDTYYDVVVFGYLTAVQGYLRHPEISVRYEFATIANSRMNSSLHNHLRAQNRKKRQGISISVDELYQVPCTTDDIWDELSEDLLLHQLAAKFSPEKMSVVRLRSDGYSMREIAHKKKLSMERIREILAELYTAVTESLLEGI